MEKKISGKHGNRVAVMKERMAAVVLASALLLGGGLTAKAQNTAVTTARRVRRPPFSRILTGRRMLQNGRSLRAKSHST